MTGGESHCFDRLRAWGALSDNEIAAAYSPESVAILEEVVDLLNDQAEVGPPLTPETFVATIRAMNRLYADGSRRLGEAILRASDHRDRGDLEQARAVYEGFLEGCPSAFYRKIAEHQLREL